MLTKSPEPTVIPVVLTVRRKRFNKWDRFKTNAWNFFLPPHIRLVISEAQDES